MILERRALILEHNKVEGGGQVFYASLDYFCCRLVKDKTSILTQYKMRIVYSHLKI